jgi:hypothetical protein
MSVGEQVWEAALMERHRIEERTQVLQTAYDQLRANAARKKAALEAAAGMTKHVDALQAEYDQLQTAATQKKAELDVQLEAERQATKRQLTFRAKEGFTDKRDFACPRCWMLSEQRRKMRWSHKMLHCDHCQFTVHIVP